MAHASCFSSVVAFSNRNGESLRLDGSPTQRMLLVMGRPRGGFVKKALLGLFTPAYKDNISSEAFNHMIEVLAAWKLDLAGIPVPGGQ